MLASFGNPAFAEPVEAPAKLDQVLIITQDVFDTGPGKLRRIRNLVNRLHWVTRDAVIRRQVWLKQGDTVSAAAVQELERNLRALDLFASVNITTPSSDRGSEWVNLEINTRDRLSLILSGSGAFLGGIGSVKFSAGESNLLGLGQRLEVGYSETTSGELRGSLGLDNVLLYGTDVYGGIKLGQTDAGDFAELTVKNRFHNLHDKQSWSVKLQNEETRIDYYRQGESIVEVPRNHQAVDIQNTWRRGTEGRFWRYGPSLSWRSLQYGLATGSESDNFEPPGSTERVFAGGFTGYDRFAAYETVTWLDTLNFRQDISLGFGTTLLAGLEYSEIGNRSGSASLVSLESWTRQKLGWHNYLGAALESTLRIEDEDLSFWSVSANLNWYYTRFNRQTLAIRLNYKTVSESASDLPAEQSLGENNGLRGYPAREFNGQQSVLLNMENRVRTPLSVASFDLGLLGFIDSGWVHDRDEGLRDPHVSAGFGIRIGSRAILGRGVIRIDVAYPFDDDPVRDYQPTVSLAVGQVFEFDND